MWTTEHVEHDEHARRAVVLRLAFAAALAYRAGLPGTSTIPYHFLVWEVPVLVGDAVSKQHLTLAYASCAGQLGEEVVHRWLEEITNGVSRARATVLDLSLGDDISTTTHQASNLLVPEGMVTVGRDNEP